jgi:hypothetical protein
MDYGIIIVMSFSRNPDYNSWVGKIWIKIRRRGKRQRSLPPFPSAGIRIRISVNRDPGWNSFVGEDLDYNLLVGKEKGIFVAISAISVSRDPDWNSLVGENPDYNLLVGKEQGIFAAISVHRDPD